MSIEKELGLLSLEDAINEANKMKEQAHNFVDTTSETEQEELNPQVEKFNNALNDIQSSSTAVVSSDELQKLDKEFDEIAEDALEAYDNLCDHAFNSVPSHQGKLFEVAASMLSTALNARTAKVDKKLKLMKMQLDQAKFERMVAKENGENMVNGTVTSESIIVDSRNKIMEELMKQMKEGEK